MRILFCNITYMNKYIGINDDDMPYKGGAWVEKNKDAHEQWNFLNYNGYCYGFVMNRSENFAIERIDERASCADEIDGVTVVWCALNDDGETVVVGWYENATVYRTFQNSVTTPIYGIDRMYFSAAKAEDCYLLPVSSRKFVIDRASKVGAGKGFGQQNYWYAESSYAREKIIPEVMEFIETHKHERINRIDKDFEMPENVLEKLSESEEDRAKELFCNKEYFEFLPYGYRKYFETKAADDAYNIADALACLHQYDAAIKWFDRVIGIEGNTWEVDSSLPYLYQQCERYEESTQKATALLEYKETSAEDVKHEIYSIIADNHFYLNNIEEAVEWLDKILAETNNEMLEKHTEMVKKEWKDLM